MSFVGKLVSQNGHLIHKISGIEEISGLPAYYFIMIDAHKENKFLEDIKNIKNIDLLDYGKVIASCYGDAPSKEVKNFLKENYGFVVDDKSDFN